MDKNNSDSDSKNDHFTQDTGLNKFATINEAEGEVQIQTSDSIEKNLEYLKSNKSWKDLNIPEDLIDKLIMQNYKNPSKIQYNVINIFNKQPNSDLIAQSQNGSGKTLSFLVPSCLAVKNAIENNRIKSDSQSTYNPVVIILSDTKELCYQTYKNLSTIKTKEIMT